MKYQEMPAGNWQIWELLGDRACGKTWAGARHTTDMAKAGKDILLVGPSYTHIEEVMLSGPSGISAFTDEWRDARHRIEGSIHGSRYRMAKESDLGDALRGCDFSWVWWDEPQALEYRVGLRSIAFTLRERGSRCLITSSPQGGIVQTYGRAEENEHLPYGIRERLSELKAEGMR